MKTSFPTIWTDGVIASFWLDGHCVRVPIKLGSRDNREHVIRWLHHAWPFYVTTLRNVSMLVKKVDGKNVRLHKEYAKLIHGDCVVEAADGDFLHWSVENIAPRKKPDKLVTPAQQAKEVHNQMFVFENATDAKGRPLIAWLARVIKKDRAQFTRMMIEKGIIAEDNGVPAQTLAVMLQTEVERQIAASMTRRDVDAQRTEDHVVVVTMPRPDLAVDPQPDNQPPARSTRKAVIEIDPRPERRWGATEYDVDPYDHSFKQRKRARRLPPTTSDYLGRHTFVLQGPSMRNDHGLPKACLCSACTDNRLHPGQPRLRCSSYHDRNGQAPPASMPGEYVHPQERVASAVV